MSGILSTVPVSAIALDSALEVTQSWRSISRESMLNSLLPVYPRRVCIVPLRNADEPMGATFTAAT